MKRGWGKSSGVKVVELTYGEVWYSQVEIDEDMVNLSRNPLRWEEVRDEASRSMIRRLAVTLLESQVKTIVYRTPVSWWQMLKRDHFPTWALRRWPVRERVDQVVVKDVMPFPRKDMAGMRARLGDTIRIARVETSLRPWEE